MLHLAPKVNNFHPKEVMRIKALCELSVLQILGMEMMVMRIEIALRRRKMLWIVIILGLRKSWCCTPTHWRGKQNFYGYGNGRSFGFDLTEGCAMESSVSIINIEFKFSEMTDMRSALHDTISSFLTHFTDMILGRVRQKLRYIRACWVVCNFPSCPMRFTGWFFFPFFPPDVSF